MTVAILDGPLAGQTTMSAADGTFNIAGTATGSVTLRASKDGFVMGTQMFTWGPASQGHETTFILDSSSSGTFPVMAGDYTLTIAQDTATAVDAIAAAPCAGFPAELASRTYAATITANPAHPMTVFSLLVSGPTLVDQPVSLGFGVQGQTIGFNGDFSNPHIDEVGIVELIPPSSYVEISVDAATDPPTSMGSSLTIPFRGEFTSCSLTFGLDVANGQDCFTAPAAERSNFHECSSNHDTMVFTKR